MKNIFYATVLCLAASVSSCQNASNQSKGGTQINTTLSVDDFEKKIAELPAVQLIDVRTPDEFSQGHLKGALNYNINSSEFESQLAKLDKTKPVLVYCLSGGRSSSAASVMADKGFVEVYNMQGGIMKWSGSNKPLDDGTAQPVSAGMTKDEFTKLVSTSKYVLIDYNAKWCKPCIKMAPMLQAFYEKRKDKMDFIKIDADENKNLLKENNIQALPVLQLYKEGKVVWTHDGEIDEATLVKETGL